LGMWGEKEKNKTTNENAYKRTYDPSAGGCAEEAEGWRVRGAAWWIRAHSDIYDLDALM